MIATATRARVWVGSLACYNAGRLTGRWFDLDEFDDVDDLLDAATLYIDEHAPEPIDNASEELWVFDYERLILGGECSPTDAWAAWERLKDVDASEWDTYLAWSLNVGHDYATPEAFYDVHQGEYDSEQAFAYELADAIDLFNGAPDDSVLVRYFDWDTWTRDLFLSDYYSLSVDGAIHVFANA